jgi:hypothetical protein
MREEIRHAFDELTEAPHPALRSALRARLEAEPEEEVRPRFWRVTVAATLVAGLVVLAFVGGINLLNRAGGPTPGPAAAVASPSPSAAPVPSPSPSQTPTPAVAATAVPQTCWTVSGGSSSSMADVTDVRVGTAAGYDRFVIQLDGPVPAYSITPQSSAAFMQDATGQTLQLQGTSGIKVVVHGASGTALNGRQTFTGQLDRTPGYPMLKEARQTGDFERTFSWGLGVTNPGCPRISILSGPDRLVVDILTP